MKSRWNTHRAIFACMVMLCAVSACPLRAADDAPTRNAVFNGDFTEGVAAWSVLGPGHADAQLAVDKQQFAHVLISDLIVSSPGMARTFSVYSTYLLNVRQDREYVMTVRASGSGHISFGGFEYDENGHHIGNNYSPRHVLTDEMTDYTFVYKPTPNARGIRPSIVFLEATDGSAMDVKARIRRVELPVVADEFDDMCANWPEYARSDRFRGYEGFTPDERDALVALGDIDTVLPPYEPIRSDAPGAFALTTSRFWFDDHALPQRLAILDQPVLAGPMQLTVTLDDGTALHLHAQDAEITPGDTTTTLRQTFRHGDSEMVLTTELTYDAMLICTLRVSKQPGAAIRHAALSIPLTHDVGKYVRYNRFSPPDAAGYGDAAIGYGPIPRPGQAVRTKAVIGSEHMGQAVRNGWQPPTPGDAGVIWQWNDGYLHTLFLGDESRGVSFIGLSTQGYRAGEQDVTARIARDDHALTLTYQFITRDVPLDREHSLTFALQFMPPKPIHAHAMAARFNPFWSGYTAVGDPCLDILDDWAAGNASAEQPSYARDYDVVRARAIPPRWTPRPDRPWRDTGFLWFTLWAEGSRGWRPNEPIGGCSTPLVGHPQRLARLMDHSAVLGHQALPYFAGSHIAAEDQAGYYYVERTDQWTHKPRIPRPAYLRPTCPNSLFANYMARGIGRMIDEYDIRGVYFDNCAPILCANTKHGCGYVDDNGLVHATVPLMGYRRLFMMVRNEFVKRGREPYIMTHAGMQPGTISFIDVELQGEGTYGSDHTEMFSLGEWRAMWLGQNQYGVQLSYLPAFGYGLGPNVDRGAQEKIGTPRLLAMALLHATPVWNQYLDSPVLYKAWTVLDELDETNIAFLGYWQWPTINAPLNPRNVYASAYMGSDKLLLVLSNLSADEQDVSMAIADLPMTGRVEDHMHELPVRIEGGMLQCTIAPKNFRLLTITREKDAQ